MNSDASIQPVLQSLLLADHVYRDMATGKHVIAGTFNQLQALEFPAVFGRPTVAFISVTNVKQDAEMRVRYVDLSDNQVLMESPAFTVRSTDPLRGQEISIQLPGFPMPHAGFYAFEVVCGDVPLGSLRIEVSQAQRPPTAGQAGD